jgi:hypothetical protein
MGAQVACIISSPPYAESLDDQRPKCGPGQTSINDKRFEGKDRYSGEPNVSEGYGHSVGQLGAMKSGILSEGFMDQGKTVMGECPVDTWHNCYDDSWRDLIVPDAFAHP